MIAPLNGTSNLPSLQDLSSMAVVYKGEMLVFGMHCVCATDCLLEGRKPGKCAG